MFLKRFALCIAILAAGLVLGSTAQAKKFSLLGGGSQFHIGDGLMLPIQAAAGTATTGTVFPTLKLGVVGVPEVTGTVVKPLLTAMATVAGPVTKSGYQRALTVPSGAMSKPAGQTTVGVHFSNPTVFAVGTNLKFTWPAAPAVFSVGAAVATSSVTGFGGSMVYSNTLGVRFGGPASFTLSSGGAGGLIAAPVTVYIKINASPTATPACTHPGFTTGGTDGNCVAGLIAALPTGLAGHGGPTATTVMTPGMAIAPNVAILIMGLTPSGTILAAAGVATAPIPTNMATSQPGPWTTGKVVISNALAAGAAEKFTLSGKDSRTIGGKGTIQLVGGALSTRPASGINANRSWVRLELGAPLQSGNVPASSPMTLIAAAGLIVLAAGYVVRRYSAA